MDNPHEKKLNQYNQQIEWLEKQMKIVQEARREYINRNNLNCKVGVNK